MTNPSIQILCTLGPGSMSDQVILRLEGLGISLFRINLSHTKPSDLRKAIRFIKSRSSVPICLDTEGAQIRTGDFVDTQLELQENSIISVPIKIIPGDPLSFNLNPVDIFKRFEIGDFISIDFNAVLVQVIELNHAYAKMRVISGGAVGRNKAVTLERQIDLLPLTENDKASIIIGNEEGIDHYALSFANRGENVDYLRLLTGERKFIISKIESMSGLSNFDSIAEKSDAVLIDRGDLSRELPIEKIPYLQKKIIKRGIELHTPVYVATNLLESMIVEAGPTRAEVNDIYNTLCDGASGLVLAAETAIGAHPIQCASMVVRMIKSFEHTQSNDLSFGHNYDHITLIMPPHGENLVHQEASPSEIMEINAIPSLLLDTPDLMDCEQIALGTYSPIKGFMNRNNLESVLNKNQLDDGTIWTLPIILQVAESMVSNFGVGDRIALKGINGKVTAYIDVSEIYTFPLERTSISWFGTASTYHPGVKRLHEKGNTCVAGKVTLVERSSTPYRHYELTPAQTRLVFAKKGWSKVIGFHTRNVVHRVHHYLQLKALEQTGADGLYISPVIGQKKIHDFLPEPIMKSYQTLLESGEYPRNKVVLGAFSTYSRYAGPREAVFTALCRKNLGCSHFIIGRDHTGVGDFYASDANQVFFDKVGDIGIIPLFFDSIGYDLKTKQYLPASNTQTLQQISGTEARNCIIRGERLPEWFMHNIVQDMLFDEQNQGNTLFHQPNK
jgi:pyruvate kinase